MIVPASPGPVPLAVEDADIALDDCLNRLTIILHYRLIEIHHNSRVLVPRMADELLLSI
tara:strand:+ start:83 stop:259 length:177 start_codon:yes stop_codon:yes gene_type:complete